MISSPRMRVASSPSVKRMITPTKMAKKKVTMMTKTASKGGTSLVFLRFQGTASQKVLVSWTKRFCYVVDPAFGCQKKVSSMFWVLF